MTKARQWRQGCIRNTDEVRVIERKLRSKADLRRRVKSIGWNIVKRRSEFREIAEKRRRPFILDCFCEDMKSFHRFHDLRTGQELLNASIESSNGFQ